MDGVIAEHSIIPGPIRRESVESILSIQGRETDIVCDTSDTEAESEIDDRNVEYEPVTESDSDAPLSEDSSTQSENEIISTKVIEISVGDEGDLELADSEQTDNDDSDSEMDLYDYWQCAQCRATNNNPLYRYCEKCFKVRKNLFPPRPKRKPKRVSTLDQLRTLSQDSGVDSAFTSQEQLSQELAQPSLDPAPSRQCETLTPHVILGNTLKRRAESADRNTKRGKLESDSDSDTTNRKRKSKSADPEIAPPVKTVSDPSITIDDVSKKSIVNSLKENLEPKDNMCIVCLSMPKSGVFVHGRIAHICCCYKCAVKVWLKAKRCPVCNCKVSNVLRAVVM